LDDDFNGSDDDDVPIDADIDSDDDFISSDDDDVPIDADIVSDDDVVTVAANIDLDDDVVDDQDHDDEYGCHDNLGLSLNICDNYTLGE
jgi:hypothetical protein